MPATSARIGFPPVASSPSLALLSARHIGTDRFSDPHLLPGSRGSARAPDRRTDRSGQLFGRTVRVRPFRGPPEGGRGLGSGAPEGNNPGGLSVAHRVGSPRRRSDPESAVGWVATRPLAREPPKDAAPRSVEQPLGGGPWRSRMPGFARDCLLPTPSGKNRRRRPVERAGTGGRPRSRAAEWGLSSSVADQN